MGFADSLETVADRCGLGNEDHDSHRGAAAGTDQWQGLVEACEKHPCFAQGFFYKLSAFS